MAANPESERLHEERARFMPGGNTPTTIHQPPFTLTIGRGDGARMTDADGHEYVDFLGEYTAGLYGHSTAVITDAIRAALADGFDDPVAVVDDPAELRVGLGGRRRVRKGRGRRHIWRSSR